MRQLSAWCGGDAASQAFTASATASSVTADKKKFYAGLHGAKLAIMGRRQQVIQEAAEKLQAEGLEAIGVQVKSISALSTPLLSTVPHA